jgi:4-amino-4-deoxy-L-arabinose transferase-like glycosyltransferase
LLGLLLAALFLPSLRSHDPWDPDEARYVEVAREMRVGGDAVLPRLDGEPYAEKPPLLFWLVAALSRLAGDDALAARLVAAAASVVTVAATMRLARRAAPGAEVAAGAVLASSVLFLELGQQGVIDPLLTACATVATVALVESADARGRARAAAVAIAWSALALGGLAKGAAGIVVPAIAAGAATAATAATATARRRRAMPLGAIAGGVGLAAGVAILWLRAAAGRAGPAGEGYWHHMLVDQTLGRAGSSWSHAQPVYYYVIQIAWGALPWVLFLPAAIAHAVASRDEHEPMSWNDRGSLRAPLAWAAAVFLFFSAISGKRPGYILPLYPALAVLVAARIHALAERRAAPGRLDVVPAFACAAALLLGGAAVAVAPFAVDAILPHLDARALAAVEPVREAVPRAAAYLAPLAGIAIAALGALVARAAAERRFMRVLGGIAAAVAVGSATAHLLVYPALDAVKSFRRFGEAVARDVPRDERLVLFAQRFDGLVGAYTGALGYEVFDDRAPGGLDGLRAAIAAPGPLWVVASDERPLPADLAAAFEPRFSARVGRRNLFLFREITRK